MMTSTGTVDAVPCPNEKCRLPMDLTDYYEDQDLEAGAEVICDGCGAKCMVRSVVTAVNVELYLPS